MWDCTINALPDSVTSQSHVHPLSLPDTKEYVNKALTLCRYVEKQCLKSQLFSGFEMKTNRKLEAMMLARMHEIHSIVASLSFRLT